MFMHYQFVKVGIKAATFVFLVRVWPSAVLGVAACVVRCLMAHRLDIAAFGTWYPQSAVWHMVNGVGGHQLIIGRQGDASGAGGRRRLYRYFFAWNYQYSFRFDGHTESKWNKGRLELVSQFAADVSLYLDN